MKTSIKRLDSLSHNDTAATKLINDNFAALQQGVEDSLSRTGKIPNFMDAELDMNSRRIINVGEAVDDTDVINYATYKKHIGEAVSAAQSAAVSANNASNSAAEARQYARQAIDARDEAVEGLKEVNRVIDEGIMDISDLIEDGKKELNDIIDSKKSSSRVETFVLGTVWEDSSDYEGYSYKYTVQTNFEEQYVNVMVVFNPSDATSGNFAPVADYTQSNGNQYVTVYCKKIEKETPITITYIR